MIKEALCSLHYSTDKTRYEDKEKFRRRLLMYLEDFVNAGWPGDTYRLCRWVMAIDIKKETSKNNPRDQYYCIEATFNNPYRNIVDLLDFISVVYDSQYIHTHEGYGEKPLNDFVETINNIFQEESMCYVLHDNGRVRYYPDEESHQLTKSTLLFLNNPKYVHHLSAFNEALELTYNHRNKDMAVWSLFSCLEKFVLYLIDNNSFKMLNESSIDKLKQLIETKIEQDTTCTINDKDVFLSFKPDFKAWADMCHKYRHEAADKISKNVPPAIFNYILSKGISIYRFLLELDHTYQIVI